MVAGTETPLAARALMMLLVSDPSDAVTVHATFNHCRPLLPVEPEASMVRLEHAPSDDGALMTTNGATGLLGSVVFTDFDTAYG